MKKALILGTNAGQADIIHYLKDHSWEVHTCGHQRIGPGCNLADQFHLVDILDVEGVKRKVHEIKADIVYSMASGLAIRTVTKVAEELDLPVLLNSDIVDLFHRKERLRQFLNDHDISTVSFKKVTSTDALEAWDWLPCIVKPSDSQGQRGVQLVARKEKLYEALVSALENSPSETVVLEEYLEGIECSIHMIVQNSKIIISEFTERLVHNHEYFGLPRGHRIPVRDISMDSILEADRMLEALIDKLAIQDAVLYVQMIMTHNGPKIVEIAPRLDGCHIWRLIQHAKGYDLRQYNIDILLGNPIHHHPSVKDGPPYTLLFHQLETGTAFRYDNLITPKEAVYHEYRYKPGDIVRSINGNLEVAGYFIQKDQQ